MAGNRRRKTSRWLTIPVGIAVAGTIGWGLWEVMEIRRSLLAEVRWTVPRTVKGDTELPPENATAVLVPASEAQRAASGAEGTGEPDKLTLTPMDLTLPRAETAKETGDDFGSNAPAVFDAALTSKELAAEGIKLLDAGRIIDGRAELNAALERAADEREAVPLRGMLTELNASIFLGTAVLPDDPLARFVDIRPGDTFLRLGQAHALTAAYLEMINPMLNSHDLKPLTGAKVVQGPFALRLSKQNSRADLFLREMYICSFSIALPEGNYLPRGEYRLSQGNKIEAGGHIWIGFEGTEPATEGVTSGWLYGSSGPRGKDMKDRVTGLQVADSDLQELYNLLVESRSHIRVEP